MICRGEREASFLAALKALGGEANQWKGQAVEYLLLFPSMGLGNGLAAPILSSPSRAPQGNVLFVLYT
jgi:hypothetical protein